MFLSKFRNIHFQSLLGTGSMSVLLFVFTAVLFRSLSTEDIGVWFFFQASISFIDTFRQGFLTTAFVKFYSGTSLIRGQEVIGSTWFIASIITGFFFLSSIPVFFILPQITDYSLIFFLKNYALYLVLSLPMVLGMCIAQGQLRFDRLLYIRITQVLVLIVSLVLMNIFNVTTLHNLLLANFISALLPSLMVIIKGWSGIKYFFKKSKSCVYELYSFGKFTVASSISVSLFSITNTYIINFFLGPAALAIFNLGYRLMEIVEIPLRSFVATALPSLSKAFNREGREEVISIMKKYIGLITISLIPFLIIAVLFADIAMGIIGGGKYKDTIEGITAANIFRIAAIYSLISPMDRFLAVTLDVINKPEINFMKILVMLVVNLVVNIIGVYLLGNIFGIVIGSIVPVIIAILISYYSLQKYYIKFNIINTFSSGYQSLKSIVIKNINQLIFKTIH